MQIYICIYMSSNPTSRNLSQRYTDKMQLRYMHTAIHRSIAFKSKRLETTRMSIDREVVE